MEKISSASVFTEIFGLQLIKEWVSFFLNLLRNDSGAEQTNGVNLKATEAVKH